MRDNEAERTPSFPGYAALAVGLSIGICPAPARAAESALDQVMRTLNLEAAPPGPAPDFVQRSRSPSADLGYIPPAMPHKVSPRPVKTPAQIQAQKDALDAAQKRQLSPVGPAPMQLSAGQKPAKPKPGPAPAH